MISANNVTLRIGKKALLEDVNALNNVDFPTLGSPTIPARNIYISFQSILSVI